MVLADLIFVIIALYILYKLVFNFIVPVTRVASSVRDQMQNMQQGQNAQQNRSESYQAQKPVDKEGNATTDSEYIDFEEVK